MKKIIMFIVLWAPITFLLFTSCTRIKDTLYLQEAEVSGTIMPAPIHLTDSLDTPSFTISPRFCYNTGNNLQGDIQQFYHALDTVFVPSLTWDIATINAGVDMDLALSKVFAISFGINYSAQSNFSNVGGNVGIGFFDYNEGSAFRFDAGMQINSMKYDAHTIVHRIVDDFWSGRDEYTFFYHDVSKSTHFDPYFNLTFNTAYKSWPVNIFFNAGYVIQTLFSFKPRTTHEYYIATNTEYYRTDLRGSSTAGFINLTPGIFFYIGESNRILLGTRFYIETLINSAEPKLFILPMVQFDFRL
jgi:hypothetical protein